VYQIPDAARDNPWLSILSRRNQLQKGTPRIQHSTAIAPVTTPAVIPPKSAIGSTPPNIEKEKE
jgi:hypothetical protein